MIRQLYRSMMNRPTVSVIIPTYNREALLPRALDSVIAQTVNDWEIVLVDDGSTDGTAQVAARYKGRLGQRLVHLHQENGGSSRARNSGIDACRGRFVAFLDSDDEFLPRKLERQLELFERCPDLGLVYSDYSFVDLEGVRHESTFDAKCRLARQVPTQTVGAGLRVCACPLFDWLIREYFIATIVGMVRRDVLGSEIRFPVGQAYAEEWLFYLNVVRKCPAGYVDEPLCLHHFVPGSLARTDKHRNVLRTRDLLHRIKVSFPDLSPNQQRALYDNLADTCRQLGFDTYRARQYGEAVHHFVESLRYKPRAGTALDATTAAIQWLLHAGGRVSPRVGPSTDRA